MREPLSTYQLCFDDRKMPLPLIKAYIHVLLTGLNYLHKECRIVHTGKLIIDLKLENIMVSYKDPTMLADFMDSQLEKLMAFKIDLTGRPVYQPCDDFGPLKSLRTTRLEEDDDWGVWPIRSTPSRGRFLYEDLTPTGD
ncbi:uncharacterized protein P174DRAFT_457614 [Aspergillus novofumigatus IBT 16806]|uniref:Protein kinase domain-containing protein n=1 Tax=Aspergillus novofumigatus (strain IBT 16806) TaxID=1392255 RepID=A0A2I1CGW8_ASPN1|nr:uncharacterized protein P174DRAFT_457614 [Aspergillus novofumigatus IBT 16806]PKX96865.1 hypothetical protein P174DRAFT_457614 [Aspergillus novofumigatus IBT 16806]